MTGKFNNILVLLLVLTLVAFNVNTCFVNGLNILLPGGTGPMGQAVATKLRQHDVTILCRNAFLAATPSRVTKDFGWVGSTFLKSNPHVKLRDWDGGDLLDIVGCDWMGWQDDTLREADIIVHLTGGYTEQRVMACERIVRESLDYNRDALHISVSPTVEDLAGVSPGEQSLKLDRISRCEEMIQKNCRNNKCLRLEGFRIEQESEKIVDEIEEWCKVQTN